MIDRKIIYTITLTEDQWHDLRTVLNATYRLTLTVGEPATRIKELQDHITLESIRTEEEPHGNKRNACVTSN